MSTAPCLLPRRPIGLPVLQPGRALVGHGGGGGGSAAARRVLAAPRLLLLLPRGLPAGKACEAVERLHGWGRCRTRLGLRHGVLATGVIYGAGLTAWANRYNGISSFCASAPLTAVAQGGDEEEALPAAPGLAVVRTVQLARRGRRTRRAPPVGVGAAPALLLLRPAELPVLEAGVAVEGRAGGGPLRGAAVAPVHAAPDPLGRRPLPPLVQAQLAVKVHGRCLGRRAPYAPVLAAPVLLLGRPRSSRLGVGRLAVEDHGRPHGGRAVDELLLAAPLLLAEGPGCSVGAAVVVGAGHCDHP
mmetsp:Transcript_33429/g.99592  ORF Transcript_33429/g.99592 Transcript_33429/m.99592 type:complete len:301 (-) Transcript_33429:221-1123(-)